MDRLAQLSVMLREKPTDTFLIFALALEYKSVGRIAECRTFFERLVSEYPDYVPTYYQFGKLEEECGNNSNAIALYTSGIAKAQAANDFKTARELQQAIEMIEE